MNLSLDQLHRRNAGQISQVHDRSATCLCCCRHEQPDELRGRLDLTYRQNRRHHLDELKISKLKRTRHYKDAFVLLVKFPCDCVEDVTFF